jgi:TP901 family phage tail tape measure protein
MSTTGLINVLIGGNADNFYKAIGGVQKKLQTVSKDLDRISKDISMKVSLPLIALGGIAVDQFAGVEKGLREVNSLFGLTGEAAETNFGKLNKGVIELSKELGILQADIVPALYDAISAGVPVDNVMEFLRVAGKSAIGGVTDINTAVDGLSTTINAFNLDFEQTGEVSDSIFAAIQGGKTTFDDMSKSLFNVAPAAAAANVSFKEVNAAIATLTASGVPTSVATTQIRAALTGLQRPSADLDKIFQKLGFTNAQTAIKSKGLGFALDAVKKASNGNNGELQTLLGSVEAVAAANIIAGTGAGKFADEMLRQSNSAGAAALAADEVNKSFSRQYEDTKVQLNNLLLQIGTNLAPIVSEFNKVLQMIIGTFSNMNPVVAKVVTVLGVILAVVPPLIVAFGQIIKIVTSSIASIKVLLPLLGGISAPVLAIAVAVGAAVYLIIRYWDEIKAYFTSGGGTVFLDSLKELWDKTFTKLKNIISDVTEFTKELWSKYGEDIKDIFGSLFGVIMSQIDNILSVLGLAIRGITTYIQTVLKIIRGDFKGAFEGIKNYLIDVFGTMLGTVINSMNAILEVAGTVADKLGFDTISNGINTAKAMLDKFGEGLKTTAKESEKLNETLSEIPVNTTVEKDKDNGGGSGSGLGNRIKKDIIEPIKMIKTEFDLTTQFAGTKIKELVENMGQFSTVLVESVSFAKFSLGEYMTYLHEFHNSTYLAIEGLFAIGDGIQQVFQNLAMTGKLSFDALFDSLKRMVAQLVSAIIAAAILSTLIKGLGLGSAATSFKSLSSMFSGGMLNFGGSRANGGDVNMGMAYNVGERGREVFVPNQNGSIISTHALAAMGSDGGTRTTEFKIRRNDLVAVLASDDKFKQRF